MRSASFKAQATFGSSDPWVFCTACLLLCASEPHRSRRRLKRTSASRPNVGRSRCPSRLPDPSHLVSRSRARFAGVLVLFQSSSLIRRNPIQKDIDPEPRGLIAVHDFSSSSRTIRRNSFIALCARTFTFATEITADFGDFTVAEIGQSTQHQNLSLVRRQTLKRLPYQLSALILHAFVLGFTMHVGRQRFGARAIPVTLVQPIETSNCAPVGRATTQPWTVD